MKHNYRIENDEVLLRPLEINDIELIRSWRNIDSIRKAFLYQGIISAPQQKEWYEKYKDNMQDIMFIIEYKGKSVGTVALYNIDTDKKEAEFGRLMIGEPSARGFNIGRRVTQALCKFGFEHLGLENIVLEVFSDNLYAKRSYEAVGFKGKGIKTLEERQLIIMVLSKGIIV